MPRLSLRFSCSFLFLCFSLLSPPVTQTQLLQRQQVVVCSGSKEETTKTLLSVIDADNLPEEYGGTCTCTGGCVPAGGEYEPYKYRKDGSPINPINVDIGRRCMFLSHSCTKLFLNALFPSFHSYQLITSFAWKSNGNDRSSVGSFLLKAMILGSPYTMKRRMRWYLPTLVSSSLPPYLLLPPFSLFIFSSVQYLMISLILGEGGSTIGTSRSRQRTCQGRTTLRKARDLYPPMGQQLLHPPW